MSSKRPVWLVGAGRRAREGMLPVLDAVGDRFELRGVLARSSRTLDLGGKPIEFKLEEQNDFVERAWEAGALGGDKPTHTM